VGIASATHAQIARIVRGIKVFESQRTENCNPVDIFAGFGPMEVGCKEILGVRYKE